MFMGRSSRPRSAREIARRQRIIRLTRGTKGVVGGTSLMNISVKELSFPCDFSSFDELWVRRFIEGQGIPTAYVKGLSDENRTALRERLRQNLFGSRPGGPIKLQAKAWAVRGVVP